MMISIGTLTKIQEYEDLYTDQKMTVLRLP